MMMRSGNGKTGATFVESKEELCAANLVIEWLIMGAQDWQLNQKKTGTAKTAWSSWHREELLVDRRWLQIKSVLVRGGLEDDIDV